MLFWQGGRVELNPLLMFFALPYMIVGNSDQIYQYTYFVCGAQEDHVIPEFFQRQRPKIP
jgi:hypothetical protein